jgi:3-hydroxyacyl-CoA dehydrogenase
MAKLNHETQGAVALAKRVGIIGANTLGVNLARHFVDAGIPVTVFDSERNSLDSGIAAARSHYQARIPRDRRMSLLAGTVNLHHLKDCDLILEAGSSELGAGLFQRLGEFAKPGAILMTTVRHRDTSYNAGFRKHPGESQAFDTWQFVARNGATADTLDGALALSRELCMAAGADAAITPAADAGRTASPPARSQLPA